MRRALLVAFFLGASMGSAHAQSTAATSAPHIQFINPPFKIPSLVFEDADHVQHLLSDYRGRFVLLNVWATWCGPCVREMPSLEKLQQLFPVSELTVIPLSEDRSETTVSAFYPRHHLTHLPIAIDIAGTAPATLQIDGLPTTLLINPKGEAIARFEGDADWSSPEQLTLVRGQLNAPGHP